MTMKIVILALCLSCLAEVCWGQQEYCYSEDSDRVQARRYSTKTAYQIVHGIDRRLLNVPNCEAKRFWMFSRHGTRLPGANSIEQLQKLVDVSFMTSERLFKVLSIH